MKKIKKLFLSTALLGALCTLGGGLTSNAKETPIESLSSTELTENFSYVQDFTYNENGIGEAGKNNAYGMTQKVLATPDNIDQENVVKLVQSNGIDAVQLSSIQSATGTNMGNVTVQFANLDGNPLYSSDTENKDSVIKVRYNITNQGGNPVDFCLHFNDGVINEKAARYQFRMRGGASSNVQQARYPGETLGNDQLVSNASGKLPDNGKWHEWTFILEDNGDLNEDGTSPDKIYYYLDGEYMGERNFADNDNYNGTVSSFFYFVPGANTAYKRITTIDYIKAGAYNKPVVTAPVVSDIKTSVPFDLIPTIIGTDSAYLPSITPDYYIDFYLNDTLLDEIEDAANNRWVYKLNDEEILAYENYQYVGLKSVDSLKAKITFSYDFIEPVEVTFDISENVEPIPVTDIVTALVIQNNVLTLGVNEQFDVSKLFKATPSTADDLTLSYLVSDDTVFGLDTETGILKGVAAGTATLTVTANGATNVTKVITINVVEGPYDLLNSYTAGTSWTTPETTIKEKEWQGKTHNNKEYSPISIVEDDLFGTAIKFDGKGAASAGGSHLDIHVPYLKAEGTDGAEDEYYLNWDKDYKLTGYLKTDITTATTGRFSIKVFAYTPGSKNYIYFNAAPYYVITERDINNSGWAYFETDPINLDYFAMTSWGYTTWVTGFKIELGVWNVMEGVELYAAHLNLVEQDDVRSVGWNLANNDAYQSSYDDITGLKMEVNAGTTYKITALAMPSIAPLNVTYTSSDDTIATVDKQGLVTFLNKSGEVVITAENSDGTTKNVTFNVKNTAQSITVPEGKDKVEISIGETVKYVDVTITPADATSTYTVTVADPTLCTTRFLNGKLSIAPLKLGTTTITIVAEDNADATLTITVTITGYSITYNVNGHGENPAVVENVTALPLEFPVLTAEGWVFGGWFLDEACTQAAVNSNPIEADTTLYAKWTPEGQPSYKVTYNLNGHGEAPAEVTDVTALPTTLPTLTADGWKFEGWFLDSDCTQAAEAGKEISSDTILYAKWTEDKKEDNKPTTPTTPTTPDEPKDSGVNVVAIVVPIVVVVVLAIAGALVYFFVFKKKETKDKE